MPVGNVSRYCSDIITRRSNSFAYQGRSRSTFTHSIPQADPFRPEWPGIHRNGPESTVEKIQIGSVDKEIGHSPMRNASALAGIRIDPAITVRIRRPTAAMMNPPMSQTGKIWKSNQSNWLAPVRQRGVPSLRNRIETGSKQDRNTIPFIGFRDSFSLNWMNCWIK